MINFCTLFDSNYLSRGLALYESLQKVSSAFHLYVVAFDEKSYRYLQEAGLPGLTAISLTEFEDEALLAVKPTRSAAEYCWTCTPSVILYCIQKFNLPSCTYIDADMIFYSDPAVLLDEMGEKSILITEHRYTKKYDQSSLNGIYCVQFVYFKNDSNGRTALNWWRERCLEWCYAYNEDGKFGDQKYLDDWTTRFTGVHVLQHLGGGIAPWNVQQYDFTVRNEKIFVKSKNSNLEYPVVFFHFHGLKFFSNEVVSFSGTLYDIDPVVKELFYLPYVTQLMRIERRLKNEGVLFNINGARNEAPGKAMVLFGFIKQLGIMILKGKASPFKLKNYNFIRHYHFFKLHRLK